MKNKKLIQMIIIMFLALASSLVMYNFLPATLEQRDGGIIPKLTYVILTFLFSAVFSALYYFKENKAFLYVAVVGIFIPLFAYLFGNAF